MKRKFLAFWLLFMINGGALIAQEAIKGTLVSGQENHPLSFAKIKVMGERRGAISNEDGVFELGNLTPKDSLRISHYSVTPRIVSARYFLENDTLVLDKHFQEIDAIEVAGVKGALLELFDRARVKVDKSVSVNSKSYFSLESSSDGMPVELIEAYYQAETRGGRIENLALKNGRIGMSAMGNEYFVSLSTTQIVQSYNPHKATNNKFPQSPMMLPVRKIAKLYDYKVLSIQNGVLKLAFTPKKVINRNALFPTTVYINKADETLLRVEFSKDDLRTHPFKEINPRDTIQRLDFFMAYNFDAKQQGLEQIELNYRMDYKGVNGIKDIQTNGIFLFHEPHATFSLPLYSESVKLFSDYDKIVSQPYNNFFWSTNEAISPSKKKESYKHYFETHGVLLNFNELSTISPKIFSDKLIPWSTDRIQLYHINDADAFSVASQQAKDFHNKVIISELYELQAFIYLDRNASADSTHYEVQTLINLDESFFYLEQTPETVCFINLYYDLVEIHRRELAAQLQKDKPDISDMKKMYASAQLRLENELKTYLKEVERGNNEKALQYYIDKVHSALGIDNAFLIQDEEQWAQFALATEMPGPITQRYNYGSALINIGRYEDALIVLLEAEEMGDQHPWLLYNIGVCYLELGNDDLGCEYFKRSEDAGERLEAEILENCAK